MRRLAGLLAAVLILAAGCGPKKEAGNRGPAPGGGNATKPLKVGMVTDQGGIDDQSFNASAWGALKKAKTDLGVDAKYLESREISDYEGNISTLAQQGNDLVFAVGFMMQEALGKVAPRFTNTKFAIIDGSAPALPNCVSLKFREEEGCFLAGYLAGRMTKTGAIGFVGGKESDLIKKFEVGYIAGARTAKPDIRVIPKYVGDFIDAPKGKEFALEEFRQGADIIFAAAGKAGLGVLDAANERGPGFYGIGVDSDQDHLHPGRILTSMMKGVDTAVYDTVKDLKAGRWQSGEKVFGIKENGVHLSPMQYTKKDVPPDVLAKIDAISKQIAAGTIRVPSTEAELQNFTPPKV